MLSSQLLDMPIIIHL